MNSDSEILKGHQTIINVDGKRVLTLSDILPDSPGLDILFIAKTPAPVSVKEGHYFQGIHGTMFWNKLAEYNILRIPANEYEDNHLIRNHYGLTDIVKVPRSYGNEPNDDEYKEGLERILNLIKQYNPKVICFVYKKVLDQILKLNFHKKDKSIYGFNPSLDNLFGSKVFVFPMPGTPCNRATAQKAMSELRSVLRKV